MAHPEVCQDGPSSGLLISNSQYFGDFGRELLTFMVGVLPVIVFSV
jgi:hypothetical protein